MLNSIIITMITSALGLVIGTTVPSSSSILQLQSPAIIVHKDTFVAHDELLRRALRADQNPRARRIQDEATCPGTPFLWKIIENDTGNHVGFGVGTMHLPADIITTEEAYDSIISAILDSCDVYGELNFYDNNTMNEILECQATVGESATLADIPDEGLREEVRAKIVEIVLNYYDSDVGNAETIASGFDSLPFASVQQFIVNANTPEHMEKYADALLNGVDPGFLDLEVLALGRPAASLEEVSTQCDLIQAMNPSAEMLNQTFTLDPDAFSLKVRNSLNASYSSLLQLYKCGDINAFVESGEVNSDPELSLLLNGRNEQMAAKVDDVLMESDPHKKVLFAVGLAHWLLGSNNMISLLEGYGYSMERIPNWNATQLENPSNEYCGVHWNPEAGIFVADSSIGTATPDAPSEGDASTTPLTKPSQEAEKEVTPVLASSASYTVKGIVSVIIVWGSYMLY